MKGMLISIAILLAVTLGFVASFAAEQNEAPRFRRLPERPNMDPNARGRGNAVARPETQLDILADPNEIKTRISNFEGLQEELDALENNNREEQRVWLVRRTDNRTTLAREVYSQLEAELFFIRKFAVEEGAEKTTAVIDGLLLSKSLRLESLLEELQEERRQIRQEQREEQRQEQSTRGRGRTTRRR